MSNIRTALNIVFGCNRVLLVWPLQRQNKQPGTIRAPKSHTEELSAMRHGPELHDALRKTQSSKAAVNHLTTTGGGQAVDSVQQSAVPRQTHSVHTPDYATTSIHADYTLNNGAPGLMICSMYRVPVCGGVASPRAAP